ncbi:putative oxidoreductase C2F3.05c [Hypsizygus marmoreus]|uniref:Oxidoreductase C2F3.05c n=1 Tax=Hypsizygus marmoreus TaxID=39966 RepID=A0A369JZ61_HYPMA|nr:putative oxidoreductase C2F3.05c [Hypsizygus marmoreus]
MATTLSFNTKVKLNDGNEMPIMGFGTYEMDGRDAYEAVTWALEAGYRLIDTAEWYENEKQTGQAILNFCKATDTPRSDIFYTTKLKNNNGYDASLASVKKSVEESGLGYVDLYLLHGPIGGTKARQDSWRAVVEAKKEGLVKSIGISTFGVKHLQEILDLGIGVPAVHQIDLHPFMTRTAIVKLCQEQGITLEAWAPLVRGLRFDNPVVAQLAEKYKKWPAQILLRWSLQKGYIPIPKSASHKRIVSNTQVFDFELTDEDIEALDGLDEGLVTDWNPTECD